MDVEQFVGPPLQRAAEHFRHNGISLRAFDEGRPIRLVQPLCALPLHRDQAVGLAGAATQPVLQVMTSTKS